MSSPTVPYVLGGTQTEQQRLVAQAQGLEESARWMMDRINIKSGARAVDVGCGPIGITNLLSDRVGANGVVIGVEHEPRFFEMARSEQSKRGLRNVQLVNADALKTGLDKNSCDFVHERLVLINIPLASQQAVLEEISNRAEQLPSRNLILFRLLVIRTIHPGMSYSILGVTHSTPLAVAICSLAVRWLGCCDLRGRKTSGFMRTPTSRKSVSTSAHIFFRSSNRRAT